MVCPNPYNVEVTESIFTPSSAQCRTLHSPFSMTYPPSSLVFCQPPPLSAPLQLPPSPLTIVQVHNIQHCRQSLLFHVSSAGFNTFKSKALNQNVCHSAQPSPLFNKCQLESSRHYDMTWPTGPLAAALIIIGACVRSLHSSVLTYRILITNLQLYVSLQRRKSPLQCC